MGTGSFPGVKYGPCTLLTTRHLQVPRSWKSRATPLPAFWATTGSVTGKLYLYLHVMVKSSLQCVETGTVYALSSCPRATRMLQAEDVVGWRPCFSWIGPYTIQQSAQQRLSYIYVDTVWPGWSFCASLMCVWFNIKHVPTFWCKQAVLHSSWQCAWGCWFDVVENRQLTFWGKFGSIKTRRRPL